MDDDFDDFGGFEEAEPVTPSMAGQAQAALFADPSPWSFLDTQTSAQPPDLLEPKDTFPLCLETPGGHDLIRGATSDRSGVGTTNRSFGVGQRETHNLTWDVSNDRYAGAGLTDGHDLIRGASTEQYRNLGAGIAETHDMIRGASSGFGVGMGDESDLIRGASGHSSGFGVGLGDEHDLIRGASMDRYGGMGSGLVGVDSIADNLDMGDDSDGREDRNRVDSDLVDRILDGTLNSSDQLRVGISSHDLPRPPDLGVNGTSHSSHRGGGDLTLSHAPPDLAANLHRPFPNVVPSSSSENFTKNSVPSLISDSSIPDTQKHTRTHFSSDANAPTPSNISVCDKSDISVSFNSTQHIRDITTDMPNSTTESIITKSYTQPALENSVPTVKSNSTTVTNTQIHSEPITIQHGATASNISVTDKNEKLNGYTGDTKIGDTSQTQSKIINEKDIVVDKNIKLDTADVKENTRSNGNTDISDKKHNDTTPVSSKIPNLTGGITKNKNENIDTKPAKLVSKTESQKVSKKSTLNSDWSSKDLDDLDWLVDGDGDSSTKHVSVTSTTKSHEVYPATNDELKHSQLQLQEKFEKELEDVKQQNLDAEEVLGECKRELEAQKHKYSQLQEKHNAEIASLRQSSHDAIAVIVEEHKEYTKLALLQQKEAMVKYTQSTLRQLHEDTQALFDKQSASISLLMEEERVKQADIYRQKLDDSIDCIKAKLEKDAEVDRLKQEKRIAKLVQEEQTKSREIIENLLKEEQKTSSDLLETERGECERVLREGRLLCEEKISSTVDDVTLRHKKALSEALEEERQKKREVHKTALEMAREEVKDYLDHQTQQSRSLHSRQLASLDLFLESARKQLDSMMSPQEDSIS